MSQTYCAEGCSFRKSREALDFQGLSRWTDRWCRHCGQCTDSCWRCRCRQCRSSCSVGQCWTCWSQASVDKRSSLPVIVRFSLNYLGLKICMILFNVTFRLLPCRPSGCKPRSRSRRTRSRCCSRWSWCRSFLRLRHNLPLGNTILIEYLFRSILIQTHKCSRLRTPLRNRQPRSLDADRTRRLQSIILI